MVSAADGGCLKWGGRPTCNGIRGFTPPDGVLGPGDERWYSFVTTNVDSPSCATYRLPGGAALLKDGRHARVCLYAECLEGPTELVCHSAGDGGVSSIDPRPVPPCCSAPSGAPGCCSGPDGFVDFDVACPAAGTTLNASFREWIRVYEVGAECVPYSFEY
jgi:hypothetical protein